MNSTSAPALTVPHPRTTSPTMPTLDIHSAIEALATQVVGPVMAGDDPAAAPECAGFNLAVQHDPAVVVGATCAADVAAAVRFAAAHALPIVVQATGHGPVRPATGAILVTTQRMQGVWVDPQRRTARVEAGVRWREVIDAAAPHGLAPLSGSSSQVGVVGYTLGGGVGPLARPHGFAADRVRWIEVVTADGEIRRVDADHHDDLFWALRGGKGSFGVVTAMEFELVEVPQVHAGGFFFAGEDAASVLHAFRRWVPRLPKEATTSVALLRLPPLPELPEPIRGQFVVHLRWSFTGSVRDGEDHLTSMLGAGRILLGGVGPMPWAASDSIHMDPTDPMPVWERGGLLSCLPAEAVDTLLAVAGPQVDVPLVMVELRLLGGALRCEPPVPNAVAGREGEFQLFVVAPMFPGLEEVAPVVGNVVLGAMAPWSTGTSLLNHLGDATTAAQVATAWRPDVHARLMDIKRHWDPRDTFRSGHALGV